MTASPQMPETLSTGRLALTRPSGTDADDYVAMQVAQDGSEPGQAWRSLASVIGHWVMRGYGFYALRAEGRFVGVVGILYPLGWEEVEIGWHIAPAEQNNGYATEAARRIRLVATETLGLRRLVSYIRDENGPARRLAERLGGQVTRRDMFPDGLARDVFALPNPDKLLEGAA